MGGVIDKLNYLSSISQNFVHKPNPYIPDAQRQSIRFKEAMSFGLLFGSTAFKGYRSRVLSGMIAANIIGSGVLGLWMLNEVNELAKRIPAREIELRLGSKGEKKGEVKQGGQEKK